MHFPWKVTPSIENGYTSDVSRFQGWPVEATKVSNASKYDEKYKIYAGYFYRWIPVKWNKIDPFKKVY